MSNIHDVADRLAIREIIERYSSALTRYSWEEMASTFHVDAVWMVAPPFNLEFTTRQDIQDGIRSLVSGFDFLVQMTHSMVIDLDGDRASAITVITETGRNSADKSAVYMHGTYHDEIARIDGRWQFTKRVFQPIYLDSSWLPGDVVR